MNEQSLRSNEYCKKLNEESHQHATIPDTMRYTAHFEYEDLVQRLLRVKENSEQLNLKELSFATEIKKEKSLESLNVKRTSKNNKYLLGALSDRVL